MCLTWSYQRWSSNYIMTSLSADPFNRLFYFAGSSRDHFLSLPSLKIDNWIPLTPSAPPDIRLCSIPNIPLKPLLLYSLENQQTLVINIVKDEDEINRLERVVYPGCVIRFGLSDGRPPYIQQSAPFKDELNKETKYVLSERGDAEIVFMSLEPLDSGPIIQTKAVPGKKTRLKTHAESKEIKGCRVEKKEVFEECGLGKNGVEYKVDAFRHRIEGRLYAMLMTALGIDEPLAAQSLSGSSTSSDSDEETEKHVWYEGV